MKRRAVTGVVLLVGAAPISRWLEIPTRLTVVLIGLPWSMSAVGLWALGLVTLAVADFAALQTIGPCRMETQT
ncbi:hypothetical protein BH23ACT5_BH23ACT5_16010 [soil metagenome]